MADAVDIGITGNLYGLFELGPDQQLNEFFTLDYETEVTSFYIGIQPFGDGPGLLTGSFETFLVGPGGNIYYEFDEFYPDGFLDFDYRTPLPIVLPAGDYYIEYQTGPCGNPCYGPVAGLDYDAIPTILHDVGGEVGFVEPIGFELIGSTVPDPSAWLLMSTAMFLIFLRRRKFQRQ